LIAESYPEHRVRKKSDQTVKSYQKSGIAKLNPIKKNSAMGRKKRRRKRGRKMKVGEKKRKEKLEDRKDGDCRRG